MTVPPRMFDRRQFLTLLARRLAPAALLVRLAEPVPAFGAVGVARLSRVEDQEAVLLSELIHAGAGGEVVGRLLATMQHDEEGDRLAGTLGVAGRDVELVVARAGLVREGAGYEAAGKVLGDG